MNSTHLQANSNMAVSLKLFIASKANLARGLKNGWGGLVYTILISNLTRLIH